MLNQTLLNSDTRVNITIDSTDDSGVSLVVYDKDNNVVVSRTEATIDDTTAYYDIPAANLLSIQTYSIEWDWINLAEAKKQVITRLDVLPDSRIRYCYQYEVLLKLYDMLIPSTLDIGEYTKRASNEIERMLQGLYELPLTPDINHEKYEQDVLSLENLCASVAAGYLIEDISVSRGIQGTNMVKNAAWAELNRFAKREKVFESIPKQSGYEGHAYQAALPKVSGGEERPFLRSRRDPMEEVYSNFTPR